jgi:GTP cyclohydrolase I
VCGNISNHHDGDPQVCQLPDQHEGPCDWQEVGGVLMGSREHPQLNPAPDVKLHAHTFPDPVTLNDGDVLQIHSVTDGEGNSKVLGTKVVRAPYVPNPDKERDLVRQLLVICGEDPDRPGLHETPDRFLKALRFYTKGYAEKPADVLKVFEDGAEGCDEMVVQVNIPFWSMCEHHMAPFFGVAHMGYVPDGKIVGLSKLSRLLDVFARRLQVQERLTVQVADAFVEHLQPVGFGIVIEARHTCMECRGVQKSGTETITSAMRGVLMDKPEARQEFLSLVNNRKRQ